MCTAIVAALLGAGLLWPGLTRHVSEKTTCVAGLLADLASMVLLIASWLVAHQHAAAFALLLMATACLGAGFGLTVPSLNTLAAAFHPATGGQVRTDTERIARPGHSPGAGVRRGVHRPRILDRPPGDDRLPADRPDRRHPAHTSIQRPPGIRPSLSRKQPSLLARAQARREHQGQTAGFRPGSWSSRRSPSCTGLSVRRGTCPRAGWRPVEHSRPGVVAPRRALPAYVLLDAEQATALDAEISARPGR